MTAEQAVLIRGLLYALGGLALLSMVAWPLLPCVLLGVALLLGADLFHPSITEDR